MDYEEHFRMLDTNGRRTLVIAFAGGPQNTYQFGNTLRRLNTSCVLMRDSSQRYHHFGVKGLGDRGAVAAYIRNLMRSFSKTITVGVSSGAYPALLYGQLAPVDEIIAISALTGRTAKGFGWDWPPEDLPFIVDPANPQAELMPFFPNGPVTKVRAFISDGDGTRLDRRMVSRIGVSDITLIPGYAHGDLARGMRDMGMFKELFA